jgi:hypothetical protein
MEVPILGGAVVQKICKNCFFATSESQMRIFTHFAATDYEMGSKAPAPIGPILKASLSSSVLRRSFEVIQAVKCGFKAKQTRG